MYSTHSSVPSVLEYMSYCFNFHSVLAGPAVTMREYLSFMDGSNFRVTLNTANSVGNYSYIVNNCIGMGNQQK